MRKIKRQILKNHIGSNKIDYAWRSAQIKKYGPKAWAKLLMSCGGRF